MSKPAAASEKWILWVYGAVCAVLLVVFQVVDVLVTDAPEPWYQNISYLAATALGIVVAGVLLLGSFKQPFARTISVVTAALVWPVVWIAEKFAWLVIEQVNLRGELLLYTLLLCIGFAVAAIPATVESLVRRWTR